MALADGPAITARAPMAASSRCDLRDRAHRVERHGDAAGAEHGEVGDDEVPVVGGDDADPVARLEPEARAGRPAGRPPARRSSP